LSGFIYPVVVHWAWSTTGWLSPFKRNDCCLISDTGYIDFAGSGVVHMVGGFAGLVGAVVLGPRLGRFDNDGPKPQGHNIVLVALGTFILWFGWYGFNPGSTLGAIGLSAPASPGAEFGMRNLAFVAALVATNTTLSAAFGGVTGLVLSILIDKEMNLGVTLNAVLGGLVAVTAGCSVLEPWGAVITGISGSLVVYGVSKLLIKLKIDDPIDAFAVHGAGGLIGVLLTGLFAMDQNIRVAYGTGGDDDDTDEGWFVGGNGSQFAVQLVGALCIMAWVCSTCVVLFIILRFAGVLRVPVEHEKKGLDESKHGGHAYPEHSLIMRTLASRVMGGGAQGSPATAKR
jgi:ammonium transporter, Amt family